MTEEEKRDLIVKALAERFKGKGGCVKNPYAMAYYTYNRMKPETRERWLKQLLGSDNPGNPVKFTLL